MVNVGKYTIYGCYGICLFLETPLQFLGLGEMSKFPIQVLSVFSSVERNSEHFQSVKCFEYAEDVSHIYGEEWNLSTVRSGINIFKYIKTPSFVQSGLNIPPGK